MKLKLEGGKLKLTLEENLRWEDFDGLLLVAQVLDHGAVEHVLVGLLLQDGLLRAQELLLWILLKVGRVHSNCNRSMLLLRKARFSFVYDGTVGLIC